MLLTATPLLFLFATVPPGDREGAPLPHAALLADEADALLAQRERRARKGRRLLPEKREEMREEVERKMQTFLTVELSTRLGLDEKTALKLSAAFKAHRERRETSRQAMRKEYQALAELLENKAPDKALSAQTTKLLAAARAAKSPDAGLFTDAKKFLTTEQYARFVLALPEVQREMHRMMRRARRGMKGRGGPDEP